MRRAGWQDDGRYLRYPLHVEAAKASAVDLDRCYHGLMGAGRGGRMAQREQVITPDSSLSRED